MKAASRVRLCLPLPPTPTSSALPRGDSRIRFIRQLHVESRHSGEGGIGGKERVREKVEGGNAG